MAQYLVRVELFKADGEEYTALHKKMEALGLQRTTVFDDGKTYALPPGTYFGASNLEAPALRDKVVAVATPLSSYGGPSVFLCLAQEWSAHLFTA